MTELFTETFTLEPQDNARLQALCGAYEGNLQLIEKSLNLTVSRRNFTFTIQSNEAENKPHHAKLLQSAVKLIQMLYLETAPVRGQIRELDLEDVHIAIQESRILVQETETERDESKVYASSIKTKRGLIKNRVDQIKCSIYTIFFVMISVLVLVRREQEKHFWRWLPRWKHSKSKMCVVFC